MSPLIRFRSEWLHVYREGPAARVRMICFPHAGGSAAFYRDWRDGLSPRLELCAVQYPGRGERRTAPTNEDLQAIARCVVDDLSPLPDRPLALFGHSMGAFIAYEAARLLEDRNAPLLHLFVSGQTAPWTPADSPSRTASQIHMVRGIADYDDDVLVRHLERLGGTEAELLADPAMRAIFLPYIRHDYRLVESYIPVAGPPLTTPITALAGADDAAVTPAAIERWRNLTSSHFALEVFPGGHFFLVPERVRVLDIVNRTF